MAPSPSRLREQLLRIQRENYEKSLRLVRASLDGNPAVERYGREYRRYLKRYLAISDKHELLKRVLASDIVYHGDYHTLRHSQRSILAVLREIAGKREIVLCLEMFHGSDQKWVDQYLRGEMEETAFLAKIRYGEKWAYNWNPWRDILDLCQQHAIPVLGINCRPSDPGRSLAERDAFAAQAVARAHVQSPGKLIYVVDGDYHISPNHLPREVEWRLEALGLKPKRTLIYQNAENLFWKLAEEGKEEADVLLIAPDSFCLMNTMPANKLQSYLHWLEYAEDGYYPVRGNWAELSGEDYLFSLREAVQNLESLLQLGFPMDSFEKLTVYSSRNLDLMEVIQGTPGLKSSLPLVKEKLRRDEGFLLAYREGGSDSYLIYLPNSSVNMAAEEATHFMNLVLRGERPPPASGFDRFYANAITESLGFFGSKLINEKRKAPTETSLRQYLGRSRQAERAALAGAARDQAPPTETQRVARLLLQHAYLEKQYRLRAEARGEAEAETLDPEPAFRKKFTALFGAPDSLPMVVSTQLGYMLGNRLYYAVKQGAYPLREVRALFRDAFTEPGSAFRTYLRLARDLKHSRVAPGAAAQSPPG